MRLDVGTPRQAGVEASAAVLHAELSQKRAELVEAGLTLQSRDSEVRRRVVVGYAAACSKTC